PPFGSEFLGIVESNDPPPRIQDDGSSDNWTEEGAAACFVESCYTLPAALTREPFVPRAAEPGHRSQILSHAQIFRFFGTTPRAARYRKFLKIDVG
ncbi:MAG: hypothetical protein WCA98_05730, partial [Candidatus Acidiferrales bacterium]